MTAAGVAGGRRPTSSASVSPRRRLGAHPTVLAVAAAAAVGLLSWSPVGAAAALAVALAIARGLRRRGEEARARRERQVVVELLGTLALELGAGRAPGAALLLAVGSTGGPMPPSASAAAFAARTAADVPAAFAAGPPVLRALAAAWRVTARTGAPLAAAVDRLADGERVEAAAARELDAALAGPRSSARLLAGLPALGLVLAAGLGAHPVHVLLHTPIGAACLLAGVGLDLAGSAWTGALVRGARRVA